MILQPLYYDSLTTKSLKIFHCGFMCRYCMLCSQSLTQKCRKCPTIDKNPFKKLKKKLDSYQIGICLAPTRNFNPNPAIVIWVTRPMHKHTNQNLEKKNRTLQCVCLSMISLPRSQCSTSRLFCVVFFKAFVFKFLLIKTH